MSVAQRSIFPPASLGRMWSSSRGLAAEALLKYGGTVSAKMSLHRKPGHLGPDARGKVDWWGTGPVWRTSTRAPSSVVRRVKMLSIEVVGGIGFRPGIVVGPEAERPSESRL